MRDTKELLDFEIYPKLDRAEAVKDRDSHQRDQSILHGVSLFGGAFLSMDRTVTGQRTT